MDGETNSPTSPGLVVTYETRDAIHGDSILHGKTGVIGLDISEPSNRIFYEGKKNQESFTVVFFWSCWFAC